MGKSMIEGDQKHLLRIARKALVASVQGNPLPLLNHDNLPAVLLKKGASFVTLTINNRLRGCIGTLEAYQPLAKDVQEHAVAAALQDFRFPKVQPSELPNIEIEISVLSPRIPLKYESPEELIQNLRPGTDGVVLQDGFRKATFLPQVWEKLPNPEEFLSQLCRKMGAPGDLWRKKSPSISIYQVQKFHE